MISTLPVPTGKFRHRGLRSVAIVASVATSLFAGNALAQTVGAPVAAASLAAAQSLDQLVARIALYPDDLIAIVLPASTEPLQVVQAERFLTSRKANPSLAVNESWSDPIKALLNYPDVVKMMNDDLDWTNALGEAVYADQGEVLAAIQSFRRMTESAGNLKSDNRQKVVIEQEVIQILPADPQVIYVPQYNPATIIVPGGYASWTYWPTPYPVYYYPYAPGAALATGLIWGAAIGAAWAGGRYVMHYGGWGGNNNIIINRPGGPGYRPGFPGYRPPGGGNWQPSRPPGARPPSVGYPPVGGRPNPPGGGIGGGGRPNPPGGGIGGGGQPNPPGIGSGGSRPNPPVGGGARPPARPSTLPSTPARPGGAFSGYGSGRQTQLDSTRGANSRANMSRPTQSPARQPSARPSGGGGARAGGGGGGLRR